MDKPKLQSGTISTFVDDDAVTLIQGVVRDTVEGIIPNSRVSCVVSTRTRGDNPETDRRLAIMRSFLQDTSIPLIEVSAKQEGRIPNSSPTEKEKDAYDDKIRQAIEERCGCLPTLVVMLGDMITHGRKWCESIPSLNLHPDLPVAKGGSEGIYWNVIGQWVRDKRKEAGGMMHLATPELDAGTTVTYFRIPLGGIINGIDLGDLQQQLPDNNEELENLIREQTRLRDKPTHPLFKELRRAEAQFEPALILQTLVAVAQRDVTIKKGKVFDNEGIPVAGLDLTSKVVGDLAIWPGGEGNHIFSGDKERER